MQERPDSTSQRYLLSRHRGDRCALLNGSMYEWTNAVMHDCMLARMQARKCQHMLSTDHEASMHAAESTCASKRM